MTWYLAPFYQGMVAVLCAECVEQAASSVALDETQRAALASWQGAEQCCQACGRDVATGLVPGPKSAQAARSSVGTETVLPDEVTP